jgi:hypothetical protein
MINLGKHPFKNENGAINELNLAQGKYNKIDSKKYNGKLIDICHSSLNVVCINISLYVFMIGRVLNYVQK